MLAVTTLPKGPARNTTTFTAVAADGSAKELDSSHVSGRSLVWAGDSGTLLAIGAPAEDRKPVALDRIEVWK